MAARPSEVVSKALSQGYLVESGAFDLFEKLPPEVEIEAILDRVIQKKRAGTSDQKLITKEDVEEMVPLRLRAKDQDTTGPEI